MLVLRPKGQLLVPASVALSSPEGWSELSLRWRVVDLWTVPAEELLSTGDPGLMPWAPLTRFAGSPERILRQCRAVIDGVRDAGERANLLAVTQVLTRLRYNDPGLLRILGGHSIMIESPLLRELKDEWTAEAKAEAILRVLEYRFERVPVPVQEAVRGTRDVSRLEVLLERATRCADLEDFRARLSA